MYDFTLLHLHAHVYIISTDIHCKLIKNEHYCLITLRLDALVVLILKGSMYIYLVASLSMTHVESHLPTFATTHCVQTLVTIGIMQLHHAIGTMSTLRKIILKKLKNNIILLQRHIISIVHVDGLDVEHLTFNYDNYDGCKNLSCKRLD